MKKEIKCDLWLGEDRIELVTGKLENVSYYIALKNITPKKVEFRVSLVPLQGFVRVFVQKGSSRYISLPQEIQNEIQKVLEKSSLPIPGWVALAPTYACLGTLIFEKL